MVLYFLSKLHFLIINPNLLGIPINLFYFLVLVLKAIGFFSSFKVTFICGLPEFRVILNQFAFFPLKNFIFLNPNFWIFHSLTHFFINPFQNCSFAFLRQLLWYFINPILILHLNKILIFFTIPLADPHLEVEDFIIPELKNLITTLYQ